MNSNYFCRKILSNDNLDHVKNTITSENVKWEDGNNSVINKKVENIKKVLETFDQGVFDIIMSDLDKDIQFSSIVVPKETNNVIISKIAEGGYYQCHLDSEFNGTYSTTIFLNDPEEYDGGELQLLIDGNLKNIKLKSGMGVTYETGIPHQVLPVTRGTRYAAVFWTTSIILDPFIRKMHSDLTNIQLNLRKLGYSRKTYTNIKEFVKDPSVEIEMVKKNLIRRYL